MVRIANCSGFYGDRLSAAREMVDGGPIDVLSGDWLAELTMLILAKNRMKDPDAGFARTFVTQVEQVLGTCLERGIRIVSNAGGLSPRGCAAAVEAVAARLGLAPKVAWVGGDDLLPRFGELRDAGVSFANLDTGEPLADRTVLTANAYLGGWGIAEALARGADVVVTGRVTDAALVVGPAAWHHGWARDDWDALAGAVVAGHVIECGPQCTGGNYAFFQDVPGLEHPGFPIAEVEADGSSVITKHESHGGLVSTGTVTAQLLYEIGSPRYANPDVVARFDTIELEDVGPDRVRISGVVGEPPPASSKVCINTVGGYKATYTFPLVGLDVEAKADLLLRSLLPKLGPFDAVETELVGDDLRVTFRDRDEHKFGRRVFGAITELALANIPGFHGAGSTEGSYGVYWPALVPNEVLAHEVHLGGDVHLVDPTPGTAVAEPLPEPEVAAVVPGPTRRAPLGRVAGARSGDKGGNANVGVWARSDAGARWLLHHLTVDRFRELLPEVRDLPVDRHVLANLRAVNFVVHGLLGEGVASSSRADPQAKSLGEQLRACIVDVPEELLP